MLTIPDDHLQYRSGGVYITPFFTKFLKLVNVLWAADRGWLRALSSGVAAGTEHLRVLRHLGCNTVIDIGANRGQFALVARHCFPVAGVISFEPLPGPAAIYRRIFANDANTILYEVAIGIVEERCIIHISAQDDSSSLLPFTTLQKDLFPGTSEVGVASVQVAPLDRFVSASDILEPAMLKLDVQGFELTALKGCESLLRYFAYVYVECSFVELYANQAFAHEIIRYLDTRGFSLAGIYNMRYDRNGMGIQADFLFQKTSLPLKVA